MRTLSLLALAPLLAMSVVMAQSDPVQEVMAVRAGIGPAFETRDIAALEKIWSPEMKVNSPDNKVLDRSTVLGYLKKGGIQYSSFTETIESTSVFKDVVIIMGHENLVIAVGPEAGKPQTRRFTDVWQRSAGGSWMLIARQATYTQP
jgi:ketosteroid isomerase-like protein